MIMFGNSDWIKTYDKELDRIRNLGGRIRMHWMMITWIGEASVNLAFPIQLYFVLTI